MTKKYILFDLDGTLTDPKEGITKSMEYALKHVGIEVHDLDSLEKHIGPPLHESLKEFWKLNDEEAQEAIRWYREYFAEKGMYQNIKYPGIDKLLQALVREGKILILATSKAEKFARLIMEHFELDKYFTDICGATLDGERGKKGDVIRYALEKNYISDTDEVVMVGDRLHDVVGAKENKIPCVGVLYGYGSREELEHAGADKIAKDMKALKDILLEED